MIIGFVIWSIVTAFFVAIGISCRKSDEPVAIVPWVKEKIQEYVKNEDEIIFTRDTHYEDYLQTTEGTKLPVEHCIKGTEGWQIADGLYVEGCKIICYAHANEKML